MASKDFYKINAVREKFAGRFGVIVAMSGSAIGLGNMWRFPYMVGQNGGAAFILLYVVMLLLISLPVFITEYMLGRRSRSNSFRAFGKLSGKKVWNFAGILCILTSFCMMSFYCVVGGWTVKYMLESFTLNMAQGADFSIRFNEFISSPVSPIAYTAIFLVLNAVIICAGVRKGIERFSKIMMLVLFAIIILVTVRSLALPGSVDGLKFLFKPDFSKIDSSVMMSALGQSFFSISIGGGAILTYGSYVRDSENIVSSSAVIVGLDTLFAIFAGMAIFPAIFAIANMNGTIPEIEAGPGLVFITLPYIFQKMPLGGIISVLFFFNLLMAAVTSSISQMEEFVAFLLEECKLKRVTATIIASTVYVICGTVCSLSFGVLSDVSILGNSIFDFMDKLTSNVMLTCGGLFIVLFASWILKKEDFIDELSNHGSLGIPLWLLNVLFILVRFVAPVGIIAIFLSNIL